MHSLRPKYGEVSCSRRSHDTTKGMTTYILSKYRTRIKPTWWKWLDEIPVYPQEHFAYHKRPFWPFLCLKRIGLPCCTFVTTIVTFSLQITLLSNYSATYNSSTCRHYLAENHLSFPSAPRWVRHSYLSKRDTIDPIYLWVINRHKEDNQK